MTEGYLRLWWVGWEHVSIEAMQYLIDLAGDHYMEPN